MGGPRLVSVLSGGGPIDVLGWLPPGALAEALVLVRDEQWSAALARAAVGLVGIALAMLVWGWVIRSLPDGGSGSREARTGHGRPDRSSLVPWVFAMAPESATVASAAQHWRYAFFRDPHTLQTMVTAPVVAVLTAHPAAIGTGVVAGSVTLATVSVVIAGGNLFGTDDRGFDLLLTLGAPWRAVLAGKVLAVGLYLAALVTVFTVTESVLANSVRDLAPALFLALATLAAGTGVGAISSVRAPSNVVGDARRGRALVAVILSLSALGTLLGLGAVTWRLLDDVVPPVVSSTLLLLLGCVLGWSLTRWAAHLLTNDPWRVRAGLRL